MKPLLPLILLLLLAACQRIESGHTLDADTIQGIRRLGLLERDEHIQQFYSNYSKDKAGNFFTDRRIAHYWLDDEHSERSEICYAYYRDIAAIDTTFLVGDLDIPFMTVHKKDGSSFKVYISGSKAEEKAFFEMAMRAWQQADRRQLGNK